MASHKEPCPARGSFWALLILCLGSIVSCLLLANSLTKANGRLKKLENIPYEIETREVCAIEYVVDDGCGDVHRVIKGGLSRKDAAAEFKKRGVVNIISFDCRLDYRRINAWSDGKDIGLTEILQ